MAAGSAKPPSPGSPQEERFGPLEVMRVAKDDGRALILYSHEEEGPEALPEPEPPAAREAQADERA